MDNKFNNLAPAGYRRFASQYNLSESLGLSVSTQYKHQRLLLSALALATAVAFPPAASAQAQRTTASIPAPTALKAEAAELNARGVVRPWHEVKIAADIVAKVKALPLRAGDSFEAGALLIEFDCTRLQADLRAAKAVEAEHAAIYRTNQTLHKHRAAGTNDVEVARARFAKATADAESLALRINQCRIEAPFKGRVAERMIDLHEMPQANQPLLRVLNAGETEVALIVPAAWLRWLKPGAAFEHQLDDTGAVLKGEVTRLGAAIDPVSQTIEVFGSIKASGETSGTIVLPGMGGVARFAGPQG